MKNKNLVVFAALAALPLVSLAQKPVTQTEAVEVSASIVAIDHTARLVTLKHKDGVEDTVYAGPEVKRFDELKAGDTVTFRYYESVALQIRKAGQPASATADGDAKLVRGTGPKPGGTISKQLTATVTVKAVDAKVPSVTVLTEDGHTASFKVEDKKNIEGLKAGDKVEITYTQALMVTVK